MSTTTLPVLAHRHGRLGHIELNRPRAINALTHDMVAIIQATLDEWEIDPGVETVLLTGSGERGLCAGGDVVAIYRDLREGGDMPQRFWRDEYRLNAAIAGYPKPFVAIMDGIVLGGGVGLSAHAGSRIVTERSSVGMPETIIGFFPDVGATYLLSRAPGELGTHMALTGEAVPAADAIAVGLADHYVPSDQLETLIASLASTEANLAIKAVAQPAPESSLEERRGWIDTAYAGDDPMAIVDALRAAPQAAAHTTADTISSRSPTSVAVTLRALRLARSASLSEVLENDGRLAVRVGATPDFAEGVRAQVIDKDRDPRWSPATLAEVDRRRVDEFFAPD